MPHKKSQKHQKKLSPIVKPEIGSDKPPGLPFEVASIRKEIKAFFESLDDAGKKIGSRTGAFMLFTIMMVNQFMSAKLLKVLAAESDAI